MKLEWKKEKDRYMIPVDEREIPKGTWRNVTRDQVVDVTDVRQSEMLGVKVVEYYWKDCQIGRYYYMKPLTQFLRSYAKAR